MAPSATLWATLIFAGTYLVLATGRLPGFRVGSRLRLEHPAILSAFAAVLSNIVSNVPAVLVFRPFIPRLADPGRAWLTLPCPRHWLAT